MKVTHFWSDEDTVFAARFDDGWIVAATEKAATTIDAEGVIVGVWWKEEPTDAHYQMYVHECGSLPTTQPISEEMDDLIFKAGHHTGEIAAWAARELKALIDGLIS